VYIHVTQFHPIVSSYSLALHFSISKFDWPVTNSLRTKIFESDIHNVGRRRRRNATRLLDANDYCSTASIDSMDCVWTRIHCSCTSSSVVQHEGTAMHAAWETSLICWCAGTCNSVSPHKCVSWFPIYIYIYIYSFQQRLIVILLHSICRESRWRRKWDIVMNPSTRWKLEMVPIKSTSAKGKHILLNYTVETWFIIYM
jgi:hypothetical protein